MFLYTLVSICLGKRALNNRETLATSFPLKHSLNHLLPHLSYTLNSGYSGDEHRCLDHHIRLMNLENSCSVLFAPDKWDSCLCLACSDFRCHRLLGFHIDQGKVLHAMAHLADLAFSHSSQSADTLCLTPLLKAQR